MYKTIRTSPPAVKAQGWKDLTAMCLESVSHHFHLQGVDFSYLKDFLAHETVQSLQLIVRILNKRGGPTLMHFVFGLCSIIEASKKGDWEGLG